MNSQVIIIMIVGAILFIGILYLILKSPYQFKYFNYDFDVSGKRMPDIMNFVDKYINEDPKLTDINTYYDNLLKWYEQSKKDAESSFFKTLRTIQLAECLDFEHCIQFTLYRNQTRYVQRNYIKSSYTVQQTIDSCGFSIDAIRERAEKLEKINNECTLLEYETKNQRKLMTAELKNKVKVRDNYTCQCCGKYMPDEVGLHIDHIVPVSKGGKSILSNLQVLCSKCNGKKSNK